VLLANSITSNSLENNKIIPNSQYLLYKAFCAPIKNREQRRKAESEGDHLYGDLFPYNLGSNVKIDL
jgi:hypothetical protein